jgi:hypothetical protein
LSQGFLWSPSSLHGAAGWSPVRSESCRAAATRYYRPVYSRAFKWPARKHKMPRPCATSVRASPIWSWNTLSAARHARAWPSKSRQAHRWPFEPKVDGHFVTDGPQRNCAARARCASHPKWDRRTAASRGRLAAYLGHRFAAVPPILLQNSCPRAMDWFAVCVFACLEREC